jgi:hypothetical protein
MFTLSLWPAQAWVVTTGGYSVYVGSSSDDIRLTGPMTV